jgi:hypothetical protein
MSQAMEPVKAVARAMMHVVYGRRAARVLSPEQRAHWSERGYLVLPGHFTRETVADVNASVDALWRTSRSSPHDTVVDIFIGTPRERRCRLSDAPIDARSVPYKLSDLYLESDLVRRVVLEARLAAILADLLDAAPLVCNSLNLEFGSQQRDHTDSLYMSALDGVHLVASWIALEDGSPDSGPLRYYAGSHRIPAYRFSHGGITAVDGEMPGYYAYMSRELESRHIGPETFIPRAGDVFIWHGQLYHGGEPIRNPALTRKSLVTHYWRAVDVRQVHGRVSGGAYWLRRPRQRIDGPVDDH